MKQDVKLEPKTADAQASRSLTPQAQRALDEARQRQQAAIDEARATEIKGLATDF